MSVTCGDNCNWTDSFSTSRQQLCRRKRSCACEVCSTLAAIDLNLEKACTDLCNTDDDKKRPKTIDDFWKTMNPEDVWRRYKIAMPGFDPTTTIEYQQNKGVQDRLDAENQKQGATMDTLIYAVVGIVALFIIVKLLRG